MNAEEVRALMNCTVKDSELILQADLGIESIIRIGDDLRRAIQDGEIPHVKVVASTISTGDGIAVQDFVSKSSNVSKSYAELSVVYKDLVFAELGGDTSKVELDRGAEGTIDEYGLVSSNGTEVTASNDTLFYCGETSRKVRPLIKDVDIIKFRSPGAALSMLVTEGVGIREFTRTGGKIAGAVCVPVRQYFNLSPFLAVRRYLDGDKTVKLMYKRDIDESVLQSIIRNYATMLDKEDFGW